MVRRGKCGQCQAGSLVLLTTTELTKVKRPLGCAGRTEIGAGRCEVMAARHGKVFRGGCAAGSQHRRKAKKCFCKHF